MPIKEGLYTAEHKAGVLTTNDSTLSFTLYCSIRISGMTSFSQLIHYFDKIPLSDTTHKLIEQEKFSIHHSKFDEQIKLMPKDIPIQFSSTMNMKLYRYSGSNVNNRYSMEGRISSDSVAR